MDGAVTGVYRKTFRELDDKYDKIVARWVKTLSKPRDWRIR
jgi:hypothetical protein